MRALTRLGLAVALALPLGMDGSSAAACQVGNEIWLGTNRGEIIAYFQAP